MIYTLEMRSFRGFRINVFDSFGWSIVNSFERAKRSRLKGTFPRIWSMCNAERPNKRPLQFRLCPKYPLSFSFIWHLFPFPMAYFHLISFSHNWFCLFFVWIMFLSSCLEGFGRNSIPVQTSKKKRKEKDRLAMTLPRGTFHFNSLGRK